MKIRRRDETLVRVRRIGKLKLTIDRWTTGIIKLRIWHECGQQCSWRIWLLWGYRTS
jgi:hypothetical protein